MILTDHLVRQIEIGVDIRAVCLADRIIPGYVDVVIFAGHVDKIPRMIAAVGRSCDIVDGDTHPLAQILEGPRIAGTHGSSVYQGAVGTLVHRCGFIIDRPCADRIVDKPFLFDIRSIIIGAVDDLLGSRLKRILCLTEVIHQIIVG